MQKIWDNYLLQIIQYNSMGRQITQIHFRI